MDQSKSLTLKNHINSSFRDGFFTNANVGMAESYFIAFMLALGLSEVAAGLSIILAQFIGVLSQMLVLKPSLAVASLRKRLLIFLPLQAVAFVPLIFMGLEKKSSPGIMVICLGFYWFNLLSLNPPWWRLMGHTIPRTYRLRFFSYRNLLCQLATFFGLGLSGILLYLVKPRGLELAAFVGIFIIGFLFKVFSWMEIKFRHRDFIVPAGDENYLTFTAFLKGLRNTEQGKLITFLFFFYVTVHSSASYFNPYMLGPLGFNYIDFMVVIGVSYFGRVIGSRVMQKRAKPHQMNQILFIVTLGIALNPFLWVISRNFGWILMIEFVSGLNWAGLELATSLLFYQRIKDQDRTSIMTYISFIQVGGMALGCSIGALFLHLLPTSWDKFLVLFLFSTCFRLFGFVFSPHFKYRKEMPELWANVRGPGRWFGNFFDRGK
jgi:MFS family permease